MWKGESVISRQSPVNQSPTSACRRLTNEDCRLSLTLLSFMDKEPRTLRTCSDDGRDLIYDLAELRRSHTSDRLANDPDSMNQIDLGNRHAIITGGAQGIGFSVARRFSPPALQSPSWDRDQQLLASAAKELGAHGTVDAVTADVTDPESIRQATDSTANKFGHIDILVANAGISGPTSKPGNTPSMPGSR